MTTEQEYWSRRQARVAAAVTYSATRMWVKRGLVRAKSINGRPCLLRADVEALITARQHAGPRRTGVAHHTNKTKRRIAEMARRQWAARRQYAHAS